MADSLTDNRKLGIDVGTLTDENVALVAYAYANLREAGSLLTQLKGTLAAEKLVPILEPFAYAVEAYSLLFNEKEAKAAVNDRGVNPASDLISNVGRVIVKNVWRDRLPK